MCVPGSLAARAPWLAAIALVSACSDPPYLEVELRNVTQETRPADPPLPAFRFSVAAIESPRDTYRTYSPFIERLSVRLGTRIHLIQRRTYREVNDLFVGGQLDAAILCTGGYLDLQRRAPGAVEVVAVPVVNGRTTYASLIIVPATSSATKLEDLAGTRFAYTDELSFSGHDYVVSLLQGAGRDPEHFFGDTIFTHSHDRSIATVAKGLVDGAGVHGVIFDHLASERPEIARQVRVIHRSPEFGALPVVVSTKLPASVRGRLRDELLALASDPEGAAALRTLGTLGIDRFVVPEPGAFERAARAVAAAR